VTHRKIQWDSQHDFHGSQSPEMHWSSLKELKKHMEKCNPEDTFLPSTRTFTRFIICDSLRWPGRKMKVHSRISRI